MHRNQHQLRISVTLIASMHKNWHCMRTYVKQTVIALHQSRVVTGTNESSLSDFEFEPDHIF